MTNDGVRVVPFSDMEALTARVEYALQEVARQRLEADVFTREAGVSGLEARAAQNEADAAAYGEQTDAALAGLGKRCISAMTALTNKIFPTRPMPVLCSRPGRKVCPNP